MPSESSLGNSLHFYDVHGFTQRLDLNIVTLFKNVASSYFMIGCKAGGAFAPRDRASNDSIVTPRPSDSQRRLPSFSLGALLAEIGTLSEANVTGARVFAVCPLWAGHRMWLRPDSRL